MKNSGVENINADDGKKVLNLFNLSKDISTEFLIYVSQVAVFFMVSMLLSNFFNDESALEKLAAAKITGSSKEFMITLLAIFFVIGFWVFVAKSTKEFSFLNSIANRIVLEIPRTFYYFGSSIGGILIGVYFFFLNNTHSVGNVVLPNFLAMALTFSFLFFLLGCLFSIIFKNLEGDKNT